MTQSSPWTVGHDRHTEVDRALFQPQLETAVLRYPLLRNVQFAHHFQSADDRLVMPLVDRLHRLVEDAVDPILDDHITLTSLDVNIAGSPLNGIEHRGIDQLDDRAGIGSDPIEGEDLLPVVILLHELQPEVLGRLVEHSLNALGFLEDLFDSPPSSLP